MQCYLITWVKKKKRKKRISNVISAKVRSRLPKACPIRAYAWVRLMLYTNNKCFYQTGHLPYAIRAFSGCTHFKRGFLVPLLYYLLLGI